MRGLLSLLDRFKVAIISYGVVAVWIWCVGGSMVPIQALLGARRPLDVGFAILFEVPILLAGYFYPRWVAPLSQRITGQEPWFLRMCRRGR